MIRIISKPLLLMSLTSSLPLLSLRLARLPRVSLSTPQARRLAFAASNLRTRQGLGFSIRASEQIHTQVDGVREDLSKLNGGGGFYVNSRVYHPWPEWSKLVNALHTEPPPSDFPTTTPLSLCCCCTAQAMEIEMKSSLRGRGNSANFIAGLIPVVFLVSVPLFIKDSKSQYSPIKMLLANGLFVGFRTK